MQSMTLLPLWTILGLATAIFSAGMMLTQERLQVNAYAAAFWGKVSCVLLMAPFALTHGFPTDPLFYVLLGASAILFATSDVIFFEGVAKTGAGVVSRLLPSSVIFSFLLWFLITPSLFQKYMDTPAIAGSIFIVLCLWGFFALKLKKCEFSMSALRAVWFVLLAATIGPLLAKGITLHAPQDQGPYAYVFCQALMMLTLWTLYIFIRKPAGATALFQPGFIRGGLIIGGFNAGATFMNVLAYYYIDNPAYINALRFLDAVIILFIYKLWRKKKEGDILSGLGMVACAAALVLLKAQVPK